MPPTFARGERVDGHLQLSQTKARVSNDETHVPAGQFEAGANPRVPRAHGDQSRSPRAETAARERARATDPVALPHSNLDERIGKKHAGHRQSGRRRLEDQRSVGCAAGLSFQQIATLAGRWLLCLSVCQSKQESRQFVYGPVQRERNGPRKARACDIQKALSQGDRAEPPETTGARILSPACGGAQGPRHRGPGTTGSEPGGQQGNILESCRALATNPIRRTLVYPPAKAMRRAQEL